MYATILIIGAVLGIILALFQIVEIWPKVSGPIKEFLSRRVVRIVLAAIGVLVILYVCLCAVFCKEPAPRVALVTAHDRYVSALGADRDWEIVGEATEQREYEEFTLLCLDDGRAALQTWHKNKDGKHRLVTALGEDRGWLLIGETVELLDFEKFTLVDADTGQRRSCSEVVKALREDGQARIALLTYHNRFVTAMNDDWGWALRAETTELLASEKFTLILLSDGSAGLCSVCP